MAVAPNKKQFLAELESLKETYSKINAERSQLEEKQSNLADRLGQMENTLRSNQETISASSQETDNFRSQISGLKQQLSHHLQTSQQNIKSTDSAEVNEELKELLEIEKAKVHQLQETLNQVRQNVATAQIQQNETAHDMEKAKEEMKKLKQYLLQEVKSRVILEEQIKTLLQQQSS